MDYHPHLSYGKMVLALEFLTISVLFYIYSEMGKII